MGTPLTEKEAFRFGFLLRCAERGFSVKEAQSLAARGLQKGADWTDGLRNLGSAAVTGLTIPVFGAAALGAGGGYLAAKAQDRPADPEEIRDQELIATYNAHARNARLHTLAKRYKPESKPTFTRF